jgi:hypothetical protein
MTIKEIKRIADDCEKTHRWAEVQSKRTSYRTIQYRLTKIGRVYLRLMTAGGAVFTIPPEEVVRVW